VGKKEIFGWAMYDFANSSFVTVIITAIYSGFFTEYIVPKDSAFKNSYWSMAIVIATVLALLLSPLVGAVCDVTGAKKKALGLSTLVCVLSSLGLMFVEPGDVGLGVLFVGVGFAGFMLGESFCASFLSDLATPKNMGMVSGIGWGIGYFGGIGSLVLVLMIVTAKPDVDLALFIEQNQWAAASVGAFFFVAAMPTFLWLKNRSKPLPGYENMSLVAQFRSGFGRLMETKRQAHKHQKLFSFLKAFLFYYAGMSACITFAGIFARAELKFETTELSIMFLLIQFSSALGALGFGYLDTKWGPKKTVLITIAMWIVGVLILFGLDSIAGVLGVTPQQLFYGDSLIIGTGMGAMQSSSRAIVGVLSPRERSTERFGFWGLFSRAASLLAMLLGPLSDFVGSIQRASLLLVFFFVVGGVMLWRIDIHVEEDGAPA